MFKNIFLSLHIISNSGKKNYMKDLILILLLYFVGIVYNIHNLAKGKSSTEIRLPYSIGNLFEHFSAIFSADIVIVCVCV